MDVAYVLLLGVSIVAAIALALSGLGAHRGVARGLAGWLTFVTAGIGLHTVRTMLVFYAGRGKAAGAWRPTNPVVLWVALPTDVDVLIQGAFALLFSLVWTAQ